MAGPRGDAPNTSTSTGSTRTGGLPQLLRFGFLVVTLSVGYQGSKALRQYHGHDHQGQGAASFEAPIFTLTGTNLQSHISSNFSERGGFSLPTKLSSLGSITPYESSSKEKSPPSKPLNILVLYPDDWRHDTLGGVGPVVQTPFLNDLAKKGIRFTHNCVTTSICWISRATLFTGQYASRHKTWRLKFPEFYTTFNQTSWAGRLRNEEGYYTGHVGKWQYDNPNKTVEKLFNWTSLFEGRHSFMLKGQEVHASDHTRDETIRFLQTRPKDRPFAVTAAFFPPKARGNSPEPGAQWTPKESLNWLYANETIPMPPDTHKRLPDFLWKYERAARSRWEERFEGAAKYQVSMKNYYRLVYEVDEACRGIVEELEKQEILNETMIIFTTDNGLFHGEHGLAGKWYPYQESIRVPLIVYDPRMPVKKKNTLDDAFTLNIDLAPTILSAAGVEPSPGMQGRDISELYRGSDHTLNNDDKWREEFFYEYKLDNGASAPRMPMATALVRKAFKYIKWPERDYEQLFDLQADPLEENDLRESTDHQSIILEMRQRHDELELSVL